VLVGDEDRFVELSDCIRVIDVAPETVAAGRQRVTLTLRRANPRALRAEVLHQGREGTVAVTGKQLVLEGSPSWLHGALRAVIRHELAPADHEPRVPAL
jgi:hypothetical protein